MRRRAPPRRRSSLLPERPHLERPELRGGVLGGNLDRLVEIPALEQVEPAHLLLGLGERPVRQHHLATTDLHRRGVADGTEPRAKLPHAAGPHLVHPRRGHPFGLAHLDRLVYADQHQVPHGYSFSSWTTRRRAANPRRRRRRGQPGTTGASGMADRCSLSLAVSTSGSGDRSNIRSSLLRGGRLRPTTRRRTRTTQWTPAGPGRSGCRVERTAHEGDAITTAPKPRASRWMTCADSIATPRLRLLPLTPSLLRAVASG